MSKTDTLRTELRKKAREFAIWRALDLGAQDHETVAEVTLIPINEVKATIRKKGWRFKELPASDLSPADRDVFRDPPWDEVIDD
jgi:hypothetical protein